MKYLGLFLKLFYISLNFSGHVGRLNDEPLNLNQMYTSAGQVVEGDKKGRGSTSSGHVDKFTLIPIAMLFMCSNLCP